MTDPATKPRAATAFEAPKGLFIRQSSGLVRELGTFDNFILAFAIIEIAGVFSTLAVGMSATEGGDFTLPLIACWLFAVPVGLMYSQLTTIFPRSGGDYVYASRVIHPLLGAAIGGALLVNLYLNTGLTAQYLGQVNIPFVLNTFADATGISALSDLATFLSKNVPGFVITALFIVLLAGVALLRLRTVMKVIFWATVISVGAFLFNTVVLLVHTPSDFAAAFNAQAGHAHAYTDVIGSAKGAGLHTAFSWGALVTLFTFTFVFPTNYWYPALAGAEVKKPASTFTIGAIAAVVVSAILSIIAWLALRHAVGIDFARSAPWLSQHHPGAYAKISGDDPLNGGFEYGTLLAGDPVSKIIMSLNVPAATTAIALAYLALGSRIVFAFSFDRLLPEKLAQVSEKRHAPTYAVMLTAVAAIIFAAAGIFSSSFVTLFRNLLLVIYMISAVTGLVGMALPYVKKDLWAASPKVLGDRWFGIPSLTVTSALTVIAMGGGAVIIATQPRISGGFDTASIITLVVIATVGVVLYGLARLRTRRAGIDLGLAMRELPPE